MKHWIVVACCMFIGIGILQAQERPYKVVFDLTSGDSLEQKAVMRWVNEITSSHPDAELEVVMYGKGFELVMPEKTTMTAQVTEAIKNPKVSFRVCAIALKNNKVDRSQLFTGVNTVPDGIEEIVTKQHEGWGYIKVAR